MHNHDEDENACTSMLNRNTITHELKRQEDIHLINLVLKHSRTSIHIYKHSHYFRNRKAKQPPIKNKARTMHLNKHENKYI